MLKVNNISFAYKKETVLHQINFSIEKGECLAIAGESGSGKSTLLKLIYGEYDLNKGTIYWNDQEVLGPKYNLITGPDYMKYVSQEFDLMPFTSVENNIGKFLSNFYLEEKQQRINELVEVVELQEVAKTKVKYLSGGQKQRVALARALAKEPEIFLLDEPFSHIDNLKKQSLRRSLFKYLKKQQITCIVATHDRDDIISHADNMLFLYRGKAIAYNTPQHLYYNPKNSFIASFFDEFNEFRISEISNLKKFGVLIIYPHEISIVEKSNLKGTVKQSFFRGDHYLIQVNYNNRNIYVKHPEEILTGIVVSLHIDEALIKKRGLNN
jgi:ABC-type Fe3+/spermidine/putrescine transport system ATPase subunit